MKNCTECRTSEPGVRHHGKDQVLCGSCHSRTKDDAFQCEKCGKWDAKSNWSRGADLADGHCHTCSHWLRYVGKKDDERAVRVDGLHYWIEPDAPEGKRKYSGFYGKRWGIKFHDDSREPVVTHNLWHQGTIPEIWRDELPDNAEFVADQSKRCASACKTILDEVVEK